MLERPGAVTFLAAAHLLIGVACFIGEAGFGGLMFTTGTDVVRAPREHHELKRSPSQQLAERLEAYLDQKVPQAKGMIIANLAVGVIFSTILVIGGIGLLNLRSWARTLSLVYAFFSLAQKVIAFWWLAEYFAPALRDFAQELARAPIDPETLSLAETLSRGADRLPYLALLAMIYPVLAIIILVMPKTSAAFRGQEGQGDQW